MITESQLKAIHEAMKVVNEEVPFDMDEAKSNSTQVNAMKDWLKDLKSILKKAETIAPSQRRLFVINYARWVKAYGSFYRTVLRNNPGLAAVFETIEDALKIEVRVMGEGLEETVKVFEKKCAKSLDEAEETDHDFVTTLTDLLDKTPSTSLKAKFTYQFNRWAKTNPRELSIAEVQTPILYSFIQGIVQHLDADEEVTDADMEHLHKQKTMDKIADKNAPQQPVDQVTQ